MNESQPLNSPQDHELQFLTDSAFSSLFDDPGSINTSKGKRGVDGLFMERLESFIEGQFKDIESFSNREHIPLDEVRKLVALPHMKYMLSMDLSLPFSTQTSVHEKQSVTDLYTIKSTLARLSNVLQLLFAATGLDSLLLVVSPHAAQDSTPARAERSHTESPMPEASWIGGTEVGKEFWMNLKGGGVNGARAFRLKSQMRYQDESRNRSDDRTVPFVSMPTEVTPAPFPQPAISLKSGDIKTELNATVRKALRGASGNSSAEMRWTKPASLEELYGVRLVGWPASLSFRNPSNNSVKDNRLLLDLLRSNQMKFVTKGSPEWRVEEKVLSVPPPTASNSTSNGQMPKENDIAATNPNLNEKLPDSSSDSPLEPQQTNARKSDQMNVVSMRPKKRMRPTEQ